MNKGFKRDPRWSQKELVAALEKGTEQIVQIPRPLNVHFLYLTAWVDESGLVQFRNDIYGRDKALMRLCASSPLFDKRDSSNKCNNVNKCVDGLAYSSKAEYPPQLETGKEF